jgi:hypothetical protein
MSRTVPCLTLADSVGEAKPELLDRERDGTVVVRRVALNGNPFPPAELIVSGLVCDVATGLVARVVGAAALRARSLEHEPEHHTILDWTRSCGPGAEGVPGAAEPTPISMETPTRDCSLCSGAGVFMNVPDTPG